jgi:A/G-specific adenine glycosylase
VEGRPRAGEASSLRQPGRLGLSDLSTADPAALLAWGDTVRRDLPWRRTRDPWAVLVSETMLQQTQVARVVPRYSDFMEHFPTVEACAAVEAGEVVRRWTGLGYNGRAVRLHTTARIVARELGGRFPSTLTELQRLPGIGPYTARAVLAFAFEADVAVVDTNVARTLARWHGRRLRAGEVQELADAALPAGRAWDWNQSLLDLGATVCTSGGPSCRSCPLTGSCAWRRAGCVLPDPAVGSAHTGRRQSTFEGSDRQGRGRLVRALADGGVEQPAVAGVMGWLDDPARAERVASTLVRDGLAVLDDGVYRLP